MGPDLDQVILTTAVAVGSSAAPLPATPAPDRQGVLIQNLGPDPLYVGGAGVTTANGILIDVLQTFGDDMFGPRVVIYGRCGTGKTADVRVMELS